MTAPQSLPLAPVVPDGLTVYANPNDLRRDLHTLLTYVQGRSVKRSNRGSELSSADYRRLAGLIPHGDSRLGIEGEDTRSLRGYPLEAPDWISYLDRLARRLGFVGYNFPMDYRGYTREAEQYPDNLVHVKAEAYRFFLLLPLADQERRLLDTLLQLPSPEASEFFMVSVRGRLDRFPNVGVSVLLPQLPYVESRRFLLEILLQCEPGVWYRTADLIAYLKKEHPFFLIPARPRERKRSTVRVARYAQLHENRAYAYPQQSIPDDAPDGFERVEGRYVERFLEGIPLTLGYLDVAYAPEPAEGPVPARGLLAAFRMRDRFRPAMRGEIPEPRVIVQPNFEVFIESLFFPAHLIQRLSPLCDVLSEDTTSILRLRRQKVVAQVAENPGLDVAALLSHLTGQRLPQNVAIELHDWARQSAVFTLYDGFGLVEADAMPRLVEDAAVERIGDQLRLVRDPDTLYSRLIEHEDVPLRIRHGDADWTPAPDRAHTVFPKLPPGIPPGQKQPSLVTVRREVLLSLQFPDDAPFDAVRSALVAAQCAIHTDRERRIVTLPKKDEARLTAILKQLRGDYRIQLEDPE
jgi:hypothetical protein